MEKKKVSFKWSASELNVIDGLARYLLEHLGNDIEEKLAAVILQRLIEKLAPKVAFPGKENKVSLRLDEAYALLLASQRVDLAAIDDFSGAVIMRTFNVIDRI